MFHTTQKRQWKAGGVPMDEARKKLRICLLCVVSAAIIMGVLYCILAAGDGSSVSEGTLVYHECSEGMDDAGSIY